VKIGIASDHAGFAVKQELEKDLRAAGHEILDYGAHTLDPQDDYPDFVGPLAKGRREG
jgi:ribose 5-phosphate isomerase B